MTKIRPSREVVLLYFSLISIASVWLLVRLSQQEAPRVFSRRDKDERKEGKQASDSVEDQKKTDHKHSLRSFKLPSHIEHDLHKEERRRLMLPQLTMNKPMYDNIMMQDPKGANLSTISLKKAKWYTSRELADWQGDHVIRLRFTPKNRVHPDQVGYFTSPKTNQCVVCGAGKYYMRFYVVPFCYRTLFPDSYKEHLSHDIVLTCADCHVRAEQSSQGRRRQLEAALRIDPSTAVPQTVQYHLQTVCRQASALLKWREKLPADRLVAYTASLREHFGMTDADANLTTTQLEEAAALTYHTPNPRYVSGPDLVVPPLLANDEAQLGAFIRAWRIHFLQNMHPRYLPQGWSVDSPVQCDKRS
jgi:hypothetical protein